jgi:hypothetical protein
MRALANRSQDTGIGMYASAKPEHGLLTSLSLASRAELHGGCCAVPQGLGNDFILVDNRDTREPKVTPEQVRPTPPPSRIRLS